MIDSSEGNKDLVLKSNTFGLDKAHNSIAITHRALNKELIELFNKGFRLLNSKTIKNVDKDYLFHLENASNDQIIKEFQFEAEKEHDYLSATHCFVLLSRIKPNHTLTATLLAKSLACYESKTNNHYIKNQLFQDAGKLHLENAIKKDSTNVLAFYFYADLLCGRGSYKEVIDIISKAIELDNKFAFAYNLRGVARYCLHDYVNAIEDFSNAIRIDLNFISNLSWRGKCWVMLRDFDNAKKDFSTILTTDPKLIADSFHLKLEFMVVYEYLRSRSQYENYQDLELNALCNDLLRLAPNLEEQSSFIQ